MDEQRKKQQREAYLAYDGGTQSHSWWQLGLRIGRKRRSEGRHPDDRPDWRDQQLQRDNRMRTTLGLNGFYLSDYPRRSRRDDFR